ncbi:MAG: response regulator [Flavobacteriaceae bacterium]
MKKVLLIEDDTVLRENTAELLELAGYEVVTASNGRNGIQAAKQYRPDVIVCDIMMPQMDGYQVLETLSEDRDSHGVPFIFLSAKTERKDVRKGMELGADDYITKPFEEAELIGAIESRLARKLILSELRENGHGDILASEFDIRNIEEFKNFMCDHGNEMSFNLSEAIYREGDNSNMVYLVLKGVVKTHKLDEQGKELITGICKADDFFGFTSFTRNIPYREYATAMEDCLLSGISKEQLKRALENNHDLIMELMQLLTESLSDTKEQLLEMAYGSVRRKTASTLLRFADKLKEDDHGNIHILRSDLAGVAGMATETLIRTLSSFKREGLIDIQDRNIKILDIKKLRNIQ